MLTEDNCDWERTSTGVQCKRPGCGNRLKLTADYPLDRIHASCRALDPDKKGLRERREKMQAMQRQAIGRDTLKHPCKYQGDATGQEIKCGGCGGGIRSLFACDVFAVCLPLEAGERRCLAILAEHRVHCCRYCEEYEAMEES